MNVPTQITIETDDDEMFVSGKVYHAYDATTPEVPDVIVKKKPAPAPLDLPAGGYTFRFNVSKTGTFKLKAASPAWPKPTPKEYTVKTEADLLDQEFEFRVSLKLDDENAAPAGPKGVDQ